MKSRNAFAFRSVCIIASTVYFAPAGLTLPRQHDLTNCKKLLLAENERGTTTAPTAVKEPTDQPSQFNAIADQVEQMISEFYPRAKIVRKGSSIDVKYKIKQTVSVYTNRLEWMPSLDGLMCTVEIRPGRYSGSETLDTSNIQYYYTRLTEAPYSKSEDQHLFAQISYPQNVPTEFVTRFKNLLLSAVTVEADKAYAGVPDTTASKKASRSPIKSVEAKPAAKPAASSDPEEKNPRSSRNLFLWKATRGDDIVYLLGTIHVAKASFYPLPDGIIDAFNESNHLLLEIDISDKDFLKKCHEARERLKGTYDPPDRLQDKLSPRTKKAFDDYINWAGETGHV